MGDKRAGQWRNAQEKSGEKKFAEKDYAETSWPVFEAESYELRGVEGFRHIHARHPEDSPFRREVRSVDPLAPEYAGLFLEFARWFGTQGMEAKKDAFVEGIYLLDTPRNADAALAWARKYGVLGLGNNPNEEFGMGSIPSTSSAQIAARRLGMPELAPKGMRARKKSFTGGSRETVKDFVLEALEAKVVLELYEAAVSIRAANDGSGKKIPDVPAIVRHMNDTPPSHSRPAGAQPAPPLGPSERKMWAEDPELARMWALGVVCAAVDRKAEDVYPVLFGEPDSYEPGFGFRSLLGGMWFQMRRFLLAQDNVCEYERCGRAFPKKRRDQRYCNRQCADKERSRRNYREGKGASGKEARRRKRYRDSRQSDTT